MNMITSEMLKKMLPQATNANIEKYLPYINIYMPLYGIDTDNTVAMFIAQIGHESINLSAVVENLNYSASGLLKTFSKYFTPETAAKYANKPEMIANRVYANRMGNGDEASGDGWRYRGRGLIQLTGKNNYSIMQLKDGIPCLDAPSILETPEYAVRSACWYWKTYVASKI